MQIDKIQWKIKSLIKKKINFRQWIEQNAPDDHQEWEQLPEEILCSYLKQYYAETCQQNGQSYSTSAFRNLRAGIQRHLIMPPHERTINIIDGPAFLQANLMWESVVKKLRVDGEDVTESHEPITEADAHKFSREVDISTPVGLQERVFVTFMVEFGRRGREKLRELKKTDILFKYDADLNANYYCLRHHESTKADQSAVGLGANPNPALMQKRRKKKGKKNKDDKRCWEMDTGLCPVKTMKEYLSKLHPDCDALWQRPNKKFNGINGQWYDNMVLGKTVLGNFLPTISKKYKLSQRYTNHCSRATTATVLNRGGYEVRDIQQITGHKNADSLEHYISKMENSKNYEMHKQIHRHLDHNAEKRPAQPVATISVAPASPPVSPPASPQKRLRLSSPASSASPQKRLQLSSPASSPVLNLPEVQPTQAYGNHQFNLMNTVNPGRILQGAVIHGNVIINNYQLPPNWQPPQF